MTTPFRREKYCEEGLGRTTKNFTKSVQSVCTECEKTRIPGEPKTPYVLNVEWSTLKGTEIRIEM